MIKTFICAVCKKQVTEDRSVFVMRRVCNSCTTKMDEGTLDEGPDDAMPVITPFLVMDSFEIAAPPVEAPAPPDPAPSYDPSPEVSDPGSSSFDY